MYAFRATHGPADLAFTDRDGGVGASVTDDFAPGDLVCRLHQVHGSEVVVVGDGPGWAPADADAVVTTRVGVTLLVRSADCVPVLLVADGEHVIGAAHCGRPGLVAGVVPAVVHRMRGLGATVVQAWVGPHVCGACYEVPASMRADVARVVPAAHATTSWGTPSVDLGAGVHAQLAELDVVVHDASRCTRTSPDLHSYRRDGEASGRQAGLVRMRARAAA